MKKKNQNVFPQLQFIFIYSNLYISSLCTLQKQNIFLLCITKRLFLGKINEVVILNIQNELLDK
ncbi:hypothetical protein PFFCH_04198 [Plasmodium falciparum FCH/4]|uniref:Uncharacterized protein n=1 Tax=Plasmodium falciparum FCH/4 TaxID=1036724 RepID=A0A024VJA8_PLAFA|nr:hypothetical protein PFFCH_04198 [Plasmodium falciparum FCH/4]